MSQTLIIACSPRKNGNSDIMAEIAYETLVNKGLKAEIIYLRDYDFSPCTACNACSINGICATQDDMQIIYSKIILAEKIIISAPVFFQSLGALAKGFVDRMQCFWSTKYILKQHVIRNETLRSLRGTYALLCGGTNFPDTFACSEKILKLFGMMVEAKYAGGTYFPSVDGKGDILKDEGNTVRIKADIGNFVRR